jgi:hypothetical protein
VDYFDREGNRITLDEWARLRGPDTDLYRRVALTEVGPYMVSTVWLGLDHEWRPGHPPLIFETMTFLRTEWEDWLRTGLHDIDARRYTTEEQALDGHDELVLLITATLGEDPRDAELDLGERERGGGAG